MPDNRKSNVSTSWGDSGWLQDGAAVLKIDEAEQEQSAKKEEAKSDNQAQATTPIEK